MKASGRFAGRQGKALTAATLSTLVVNGYPEARVRFIKELSSILASSASAEQKLTILVKTLLELLLDNGKVVMKDAAQLAGSFGFGIQIQGVQQGQSILPVKPVWKPGKTLYLYTVTIKVFEKTHVTSFINQLFEILLKRGVISVQVVKNILVTIGKVFF